MQFIILVLLCLMTPYAHAQIGVQRFNAPLDNRAWAAIENDTGGSQFDADFGAEPHAIGSFLVQPVLTFEQQYNTNVFAEESNKNNDFVSIAKPSLHIQKNIRDHRFLLNTAGEIRRFINNSSENIENLDIDFRGDVVGTRRLHFPIRASYNIDHEDRAEQNFTLRPRNPFRFKTLRTETGVNYTANRLNVTLMGRYQNERYDNGTALNGTALVRDDGDLDRYGTDVTMTYNARRNLRPYIRGAYSRTRFERDAQTQSGASTGVRRDHDGYGAYAGVILDYKNMVLGHAGIGYEWLNYDSSAISDVSALAAEIALEIKPTRRSSVMVQSARLVDEDNEINDGRVQFRNRLTGRYEVRENMFVRGFLGYTNNDFDTGNRTEHFYSAGLGVDYTVNQAWKIGGDIRHIIRDSTINGQDFDQSVIAVRVSKAF